MTQGETKYIVIILFLPAVLSDSYTILIENDPACKRSDYRSTSYKVGVDDMVLHEQLVLTWPGNLEESPAVKNVHPLRSVFGACSGILIRPSGRFVQRILSEGMVSFWLLRAEATLTCSKKHPALENYFINIDQWMEPNTLAGGSAGGSVLHDQDSTHPVVYSAVPDMSVQLNCSGNKQRVMQHISGYVRRLRITWNLTGALIAPQPTSWSTKLNDTLDDVPRPHRRPKLRSPELSVLIRLTSRMLFEGNFSSERKRILCEFFSGFWCGSVTSSPVSKLAVLDTPELDRDACIPATMRCDNLPDCNPHRTGASSVSVDELHCDTLIGNYSFNRSDRLVNTTLLEQWTSRLPWLVLSPVPLVLICALVRICSQKRHLDLAEVEGLNRFQQNATGDAAEQPPTPPSARSLRGKLANGQRFLRRKRRGLQHEVFGPSTTLASVAEVDENEVDSRSRTSNVEGRFPGSYHPVVSNDSSQSNGELYRESTVTASEIKAQPLFLHRSVHCLPIDRTRSSRSRDTGKNRKYLCWSAFLGPASSSSSSTSGSSSSSVCSHCQSVTGQTLVRSHSYDDIFRIEGQQPLLEDGFGIELQTVSSGKPSGTELRSIGPSHFENNVYSIPEDCDGSNAGAGRECYFYHNQPPITSTRYNDPLCYADDDSNSWAATEAVPCASTFTVVATVSEPVEHPLQLSASTGSSVETRETSIPDQPDVSSSVTASDSIFRQTETNNGGS